MTGDQITVERRPEFFVVARKLDTFLKSLDLPADQHNELVALMIEQVHTAEKGAFYEGVRFGIGPENMAKMQEESAHENQNFLQ